MTKTISKSSFIRGTKCPKSLWLHFFQPEERDEISENQQNIFDTGHSVGALAQRLFPGGIDASRGEPGQVAEAVAYTRDLIAEGQKVIYEAAFSDGETLCYMDILVKEKGEWRAYEVKASTSVKDYHIMDAAFQYYVISRSGLRLADIFLVHINNQYIRRGDIDVQQLFTIETLTETILPMQESIPGQLLSLHRMLNPDQMPDVEMGRHCTSPFPCDFMEFCERALSGEPAVGNPLPASRDQDQLDDFKSRLVYPLYFLDFETIFPVIPMHDENRPYQQIPFQYSLHVVGDQKLLNFPAHYYFLGDPPSDPRPDFIETLLDRLGTEGSIIVWNVTFEKTRLREVARDFPEYLSRIDPLFDRLVDLMVPFRRKYLYEPEMNGSYSLKAVLPALVPDLSYADLEIQEGGTASMTYESLYEDTDPESVSMKKDALLKYCELDTLSMVRILELL
jgi:predicted RecB family nuclease